MSREFRTALPFLLPLVFVVSVFMLFPVIGTFWMSLWQDVSFLPRKFVGLSHYLRLFRDTGFWQSAAFTLLFTFVSVAVETMLGLFMALLVNEHFRFRGLMRAVMLLPWAIPSVIGARIWQLIYRYDYGLANYVLQKISGKVVNWLGSSTGAFLSLIIADVWRTTPFVAIILLAGLQVIPDEIYRQAKVDGATLFQRFFRITLPLLKPILIVAVLFRTIDALRVFDIIYVITGGGPGGATTSLSLYGYKYFLLGDFGYGSAISISLFLLALFIALLYIKTGRFKEAVL
ncbi:sugar ABC transporter permease [bacterium]|nr:MAG: sugar ABC transporter permease [bacterium]